MSSESVLAREATARAARPTASRGSLVPHTNRPDAGLVRGRIARLQLDRLAVVLDRLLEATEALVDPAEVRPGVDPGLVARRLRGPLEPGDRLLGPLQLDQIGADVVVGVAVGRVGF